MVEADAESTHVLIEAKSTSRSIKSVMDVKVAVFLGIPFASPPVGALRFMPPVASSPWKGSMDATRFAPVCPQTFPKVMNNRWGYTKKINKTL